MAVAGCARAAEVLRHAPAARRPRGLRRCGSENRRRVPLRATPEGEGEEVDDGLEALLADLDLDMDLDELLEPPSIDGDLSELLADSGAAEVDAATGVALTYNNDVDAYDAALGAEDTSRAAVVDLSHGGRVRVAGEGRRAFLVRETTYGGRPGELAMVGGAGEALDVALCVAQGRSEMLMVAPESRGDAARELQARVRGGEDVSVTDVSGATAQFAIVGEGATESLRSLLGQENAEAEAVLGGAVGDACMVGLEGAPCSLIRAEPLGPHTPVFMLVVDASVTAEAFAALCKAGCVPMGSNCFEKLRVRCGRPRRGFELGVAEAARTPLEANLWHACPAVEGSQESAAEASAGVAEVRQRAAARAMEHQLWSLELPVYVPPGDAVEVDGADQGMLTSVTQTPAGDIWALAYIKAKVGIADGDTVRVGTRRAVVRMPEYGSRRAA